MELPPGKIPQHPHHHPTNTELRIDTLGKPNDAYTLHCVGRVVRGSRKYCQPFENARQRKQRKVKTRVNITETQKLTSTYKLKLTSGLKGRKQLKALDLFSQDSGGVLRHSSQVFRQLMFQTSWPHYIRWDVSHPMYALKACQGQRK